jgi:isoamylase
MSTTSSPQKALNTSTGQYYPLGATVQTGGVNFALYSQNATDVFLLLFDKEDGDATDVIQIESRTKFVWHVFVEGLRPGQLYGFKVRGPFDPGRGMRFNDRKLLIDPYAKALTGKFRSVDNLLLAYDPQSFAADKSLDTRENDHVVPKSIVVDDRFDWQGDTPPCIPIEKLYVYEVHVKGFTAHASSAVQHPGTYLGFIDKIPHLTQLGVNAVELLPVHESYAEDFLLSRGLTNYWGYNTIGFFAPECSYSTQRSRGCQVTEFKTLVRELHKAGIEVILDVVFNHTAEGNEKGPTLCFKGVDNPTYYSLTGNGDDPYRYYMNYTGTGNTMNLANTHVIRFVMDSLRYWVEVMHVDGFRFDLASVLGRTEGQFQKSASFFDAISQDPVLQRVKLIAEPWDLGTYQVGNFPVDWSEWNGRFRDSFRKFEKGDAGQLAEIGYRLAGSADLYADDGRSAYNSINFITCHDGFTLYDLVSYNSKHNEANLEHNQDGTNDNNSWNCGAEGPTTDPDILRLRKQIIKNHACVLFFSMGTPMMLGGDEFGRTQRGNNNAYCQDNDLSWFDWSLASKNADILEFFRKAIAFTKKYTVLQNRKFFLGRDMNMDNISDISWFGTDLGAPRWNDPEARSLCYRLDGGETQSALGRYYLFVILNADFLVRAVRLPKFDHGVHWFRVVDTSLPSGQDFMDIGAEIRLDPEDSYLVNPRSTILLLGR